MYQRIKELADGAIALQNKLNMEAALREIGEICSTAEMLRSVDVMSQEKAAAMIARLTNPDDIGASPYLMAVALRAKSDKASTTMEAGEKLSQGDAIVLAGTTQGGADGPVVKVSAAEYMAETAMYEIAGRIPGNVGESISDAYAELERESAEESKYGLAKNQKAAKKGGAK